MAISDIELLLIGTGISLFIRILVAILTVITEKLDNKNAG
jgi:hypothetical protein